MNTTAVPGCEVRQRMDDALDQLAAQIKRSVPSLRYSVQHGGNECFPWWIVARFVHGADESRVVDISIDCKGTPQEWCIQADVARENGFVLRESPAFRPFQLANGEQPTGSVEGAVAQVEGFLLQQIDCMIQELTS